MGRKRKDSKKNNQNNFEQLNLEDSLQNSQQEEFDDFQYDQDQIDYLSQLQQQDRNFQKQMSKKRKSKEYYVKGKDLIEQIRKYQQSRKKDPEGKGYISEELGSMILKICTRFSLHPKFYGYTYRDQMVADAVMRCLSKSIARIDLSLPNCNPFSYFTQTALNCFRARINSQKKFMSTKKRFRQQYYDQYEQEEGLQHTKENQQDD